MYFNCLPHIVFHIHNSRYKIFTLSLMLPTISPITANSYWDQTGFIPTERTRNNNFVTRCKSTFQWCFLLGSELYTQHSSKEVENSRCFIEAYGKLFTRWVHTPKVYDPRHVTPLSLQLVKSTKMSPVNHMQICKLFCPCLTHPKVIRQTSSKRMLLEPQVLLFYDS